MVATDVSPTRLAAAQQAARNFVQALPSGVQVGLVSFSTTASVLVAPTTDRATFVAAINGLQAGGGTATAAAINLSAPGHHAPSRWRRATRKPPEPSC